MAESRFELMKRFLVVAMVLLLGLLLAVAGCAKTVPKATEINILAANYAFQPSTITVVKGQTVKLTLTGRNLPHTFTIDELGVNIAVGAGQTVTKEFTVEKAGTFTFYCAIGRHRSAGMEGTLKAME